VVVLKEFVEGFDAAGDVAEQDVLLALEGVVAGDELLDGAGEVLEGGSGFVLGGDEARGVAVGEQVEEGEEEKEDDELRAPGNDDALEQEAGELGAVLEEEEEEGEEAAGAAGEGGFEVAWRGLAIKRRSSIVHGRKPISGFRIADRVRALPRPAARGSG
jgi:hypothetical protein